VFEAEDGLGTHITDLHSSPFGKADREPFRQ
jgi:hypothetical protein